MAYFRRRNVRNETDRSLEFANELEPPKVRNALLVPVGRSWSTPQGRMGGRMIVETDVRSRARCRAG